MANEATSTAPFTSPAETLDAATAIDTNDEAMPLPESTENNYQRNNDTQQVQYFLRRLPPMERAELQTIVNAFSSTSVGHGDAQVMNSSACVDTELLELTFWKDYNIRTCHIADDEKEEEEQQQQNKSPITQSLFADEVRHLRELVSTYQSSHYANKDGVTARFTVTEVVAPCDSRQSPQDITTTENAAPDDSAKVDDEMPGILLNTYVEHLDAANGNAGYWQGSWHVHVQNETQANVAGHLQLHTHAAERGSPNQIQSQALRNYQATVSTREEKVNSIVAEFEKSTLSYAEKLMMKVIQYITSQEEQFYQNLEQWFQEPQEDSLRKLRRILPITKTRFKWDSSAQRSVQLLNARKIPPSKAGLME
jgi:F-actin capping protein alpha subunit